MTACAIIVGNSGITMRTYKLHHRIPIVGRPYLQRDEARLELNRLRKELSDAKNELDSFNNDGANILLEDNSLTSMRDFFSHIGDGRNHLRHFFELYEIYSDLYRSYTERGVVTTIEEHEEPAVRPHFDRYLGVGADALRVIIAALVSNLRSPPASILDLPCGYGRVTRHLRAFFPDAHITVCDLYDDHIKFCANTFNAEGVMSKEDIGSLSFERSFDLIFCGSLVTHLPSDLIEATLQLLSRSLTDSGIAIVTLHGRHSEYRQRKLDLKYFDPEMLDLAKSTLPDTGFAYTEYDKATMGAFDKQASYGISFSRPHWIAKILEKDFSKRILGYVERGWDAHQDVLIIGGPRLNR